MDFLVIGGCIVVGVFVGYQWGYDIGYHDALNDKVAATLRSRIYRTFTQ
jgi:hypothetical protein